MDFLKPIITHWFTIGLIVGLIFWFLSALSHFKTKRELKKLKSHLSDKLDIEAENLANMKSKFEKLKEENENLRMKINSSVSQNNSNFIERELEIYARTEKSMTINAPGFAQAWEKAKESSLREIQEEESGKSLPKKIFKKFFSKASSEVKEIENKKKTHPDLTDNKN